MSDEVWKEFDHNPITHSAAHHLMAIAELRESRGYARVSDVAKLLGITRGSASITLKSLRQRGLVTEDDNRFLLLSVIGQRFASAVRAKRFMIKKFLCEVLGVPAEQAEVDTCKIEHLISQTTMSHLARLLRFVNSDDKRATAFMAALRSFDEPCGGDPADCPSCYVECQGTLSEEASS